jgi:hypothetical protein
VVELTELTNGDVLNYTLKTVYQNTESDPYTGTVTVGAVDVTRDEEGVVQEVVVYFRENSEKHDGHAARRAVLSDGDLTYERVQSDAAQENPVWCKFSKDGKFTLAHTTCGAETQGGTCGRRAGWGTNHTGHGRCRDHEMNHTAPNVTVGSGVLARLE